MKSTLLSITFCLLFGLVSHVSTAQTFVLKGHSRGTIQWQSSPNSIDWTDVAGATQPELNDMDLNSELFYRVKITDDSCDPIYSQTYKTGESSLNQISFEKVEFTDQFWTKRMQIQKDRLVPIAFERTESAVEDLRRTANYLKGISGPLPSDSRFVISDLFKVIEGAAYLLKIEKDAVLEKQIDDIAVIIAEAQEEDGYLYPAHTTGSSKNAEHWGGSGMGDKPYTWVVHSHELYDVGHLYEAAVAYYQATGKNNLLNIAEKNAKHLNKVFFQGDPNYNNGKPVNQAPGHQELELALVKLYHVTNNSLYLEMAKKFIDIRGITYKPEGMGVMSPEYAQQHAPVRDQTEAVGHAVRATYLYSAMADVSALTNDETLRPALESIWSDIVNTRMHITGGLGAIHGIEGFGPQYVLPNADTYNETCAAVGNVLTNYRLFLMNKDGKYMDVAEVALLNNSLAGVNMEGDKFFYVNPLEYNGVHPFNQGVGGRASWFGTACCPTNIARLVPQVAGMMYAHTENEIYCSFYASSKVDIPLRSGNVALEQSADYPFDENISVTVNPVKNGQEFSLKMRIPTWAQSQFVPGELYSYVDGKAPQWEMKVNGQKVTPELNKGFASISRKWNVGDVVSLTLPMPIRFVHTSDKVEANRGRVAITCGPLVYCAEGIDNTADIFSYFVDNATSEGSTAPITTGILNGIKQLSIPANTLTQSDFESTDITLIPYYAWNNRGASEMMVWFPETEDLARKNYYTAPDFIEDLKASHTYGGQGDYGPESVDAIIDGKIPSGSDDKSIPRWTTWPQTGVNQWLEFTFNRPIDISNVGIFWHDDDGGVRIPASWNLEYLEAGTWKAFPLQSGASYPVYKHGFNSVNSGAAIQAEKLRVNITPQSGSAIGILELQIREAVGIIRNVNASFTFERDNVNAIIDGIYPSHSGDESVPRWTSWPESTPQQIEFTLNKETDIQGFSVYWYDDNGGVRVPQSWNLEYKKGDAWTTFPIYVTDSYDRDKDQFNMVHPGEQILTKNIRLNMTPVPGSAVGILEVVIDEVK